MSLTQISTAGVKDDAVTAGKIPANAVGSSELADNAVNNAAVASNAAIAGTKISPSFTSDITITNDIPRINFVDSGENPDWEIGNINGAFRFRDTTNAATWMQINADGHVDVTGNLDVGAGIDITGDTLGTGQFETTGANKHFKSHSSSSGDWVRMYAGAGTGKWDIYGNGANLRFSDNDSAGSVVFDRSVGIGTTSPSQSLHVAGNIINTESVAGTGDSGIMIGNGHRLGFDQSGTRSWHVKAQDGVLNISSGDGASAPRVAGLLFGSDTAAANTLDDYEEGSCVPTQVNGSFSPGSADGKYTKVGRLVTWMMQITFDSTGSNNHLRIGNFPFTAAGGRPGSAILRYSNDNEAYKIAWHVDGGAATASAYYSSSGGIVEAYAVSQQRFDLTFVYEAA